MSFSNLKVDADFIRGMESSFEDDSDTSIQAIAFDISKRVLKLDLYKLMNNIADIDEASVGTNLDSYVSKYEEFLKVSLGYLQLFHYYSARTDEASSYEFKRDFYLKMYKDSKKNWGDFRIDSHDFITVTEAY